MVTNRVVREGLSPATTAWALASCRFSVLLSRTARLVEYAHSPRHDFVWISGFQRSSALTLRSLLLAAVSRWSRGVMVSMI